MLNERGSKYSHTQTLGVLLYIIHKFIQLPAILTLSFWRSTVINQVCGGPSD